jgi:hypothetical protein
MRAEFKKDFRNDTGFSWDTDFYGMLNVPQDASERQINNSYK